MKLTTFEEVKGYLIAQRDAFEDLEEEDYDDFESKLESEAGSSEGDDAISIWIETCDLLEQMGVVCENYRVYIERIPYDSLGNPTPYKYEAGYIKYP